ncbi:hypothetical protein PMAC_001581 [Pneumocystis sp. 'macacae']|nr:hypothetical protein PMAC_001581 [Pneumocystis sp. 'macacae']
MQLLPVRSRRIVFRPIQRPRVRMDPKKPHVSVARQLLPDVLPRILPQVLANHRLRDRVYDLRVYRRLRICKNLKPVRLRLLVLDVART